MRRCKSNAFEWHVPADRYHWNRLKLALPDLKEIGIDKIWIPPGCKGMDPCGNGYDIYDIYDLGEFDQKGSISTKWGTRQDLEELVRQAHYLGIDIIWDAVLNHKAGADFPEKFEAIEVDPKRRDIELSKPLEVNGWVGFEFSGRGDIYSSMKYHWQHFNGVDWDDKRKKQAIYKIHASNKDWATDVSMENGNYDYLMFANLDLSHAEVREDLLKWGTWITSSLSLGGMRLDAAKHFSAGFQKDFVEHIRKTTNSYFFVIGEYWTGDIKALLKYLETLDYQVAAYDVPLLENFSKLSLAPGADLRSVFKNTLVESKPDHSVTIVSNHDTQPGQMLETPVASSFKLLAYALILLRKGGHPCVFYGDMYGIRANVESPMVPSCKGKIPLLTQARKLFAYGEQEDYFDKPNCIGLSFLSSYFLLERGRANDVSGFVRYGNAYHPSGLACILSNAGSAKKRMFIGPRNTNQQWVDILGNHAAPVVIDKWGYGIFPVNAMSVSVWVDSAAFVGRTLQENLYAPFSIPLYL
ncbi:CAZyme family GH13 [Penicillium macrosclerotiorum]|uniref:CAZyme family GH13 n=1 Tax=Penicillium macrosclerotiorum TaxID=303699 RepID=UPI002546994C|nr:CAZyme family GH13 [Penicillium macrosclerotiorum]KAJ5690456.1 CAZyme family GH13 [Penicillium macrosclerotiorum]